MTDITASNTKIQQEQVAYRAAVSESTFTNFGAAINYALENAGSVGDVVQSMLTLTQFQAQRSANWVLMDGGSAAGSTYEILTGNSSVPDLVTSGRFLRQGTPGVVQSDQNQAHSHDVLYNDGAGGFHKNIAASTLGGSTYYNTSNLPGALSSATGVNGFDTTDSNGGSESRPHNVAVNHFIKIN